MRFLLLLCFVYACLSARTQAKDTLFVERNMADMPYPYYHAIYIDSNYVLKDKNTIINFSFSKSDSLAYLEDIKSLKPLNRKNRLPKSIPSKWILSYKYKNEYFTYDPSEPGENYRFAITDSATIDYTMEGPAPAKITQLILLAPCKLLIKRKTNWQGKQVKINIIDADKGIAVFTFSDNKYIKAEFKLLMVSTEKANPSERSLITVPRITQWNLNLIKLIL